jgi:hypothetical protein
MGPTDVNGVVISDASPKSRPSTPLDHGQIQTADFQISGNLRAAFAHLKEMYEPKVQNQSGPIKRITDAELEREKHKGEEEFVNSL